MLEEIRAELKRVGAHEIVVTMDHEFEPDTGALLKVERGASYWHLLPVHFMELLRELPDGAGAEQVHVTIEKRGIGVWHGPSPKDSRDTAL